MRIDQLLVQRGLALTRSQAQRLIAAGVRWRADGHWQQVSKNGEQVADDAEIALLDEAQTRYVSRGGLKLEGALAHRRLPVEGTVCLDLGQSTGGFTDCLLQAGARHVLGVDVGHGQLDPRLRADPRVSCLEKTNARQLTLDTVRAALPAPAAGSAFAGFDLVVGDLAFISQTLVLPAIVPMLRPGGSLLMLVKPQFELAPGQVGKGGLVRDTALHALVEQRVRAAHRGLGLAVLDYFDSSIPGGDGNREFFIHSISAQQ